MNGTLPSTVAASIAVPGLVPLGAASAIPSVIEAVVLGFTSRMRALMQQYSTYLNQ